MESILVGLSLGGVDVRGLQDRDEGLSSSPSNTPGPKKVYLALHFSRKQKITTKMSFEFFFFKSTDRVCLKIRTYMFKPNYCFQRHEQ